MREKFEQNPNLFTLPISSVIFHPNCRDEAPKLLKGLQAIFMDKELNEKIFLLLSERININKNKQVKSGRKGMGLWEILVLGVMRQGLNTNYDRLQYLANSDITMRTIMGIELEPSLKKKKIYGLTTIKDNLALLDEKTINDISDIVVNYGHFLLKKKEGEVLQLKADSFPVGANVHFPTDMNLLWDSSRKCIDIMEWFKENENISGWRKSKSWKREIKIIFRVSTKTNSSGGKNKAKRLYEVVNKYLNLCGKLKNKIANFLDEPPKFKSNNTYAKLIELAYYQKMLEKHIDLVNRRLLQGEVIPTHEKLYSIFETHCEWLTKGKKFNPVEIGHNVLIVTDQYQFIIHHHVCEKQVDVTLTKEIVQKVVKKFPNLIHSISFDKGFYSKENKIFVQRLIPKTIMPKRGKCNKEEYKEEHEIQFKKLRNAHSAVESNINQLEHNGLGRCPDRGIKNFKRYAALSVLSYNLHKLGEYICKGKILQEAA